MNWEFIDGTTKISYSTDPDAGDKVISFNCPIKNGERDGQFTTTLRNFIDSLDDDQKLQFFQALETASKPATVAKRGGRRRKAVSSPTTDSTAPATDLKSFLDNYLDDEEPEVPLTAGQIEEIRMAFDPNYRNYVEACDLRDRLKNYYRMARNITGATTSDQSERIKLYKNAPKTGPKTYSEYSIDTSAIVELYQGEKAKGKRGSGHAKKQVDPKTKKQLRIAALVTGTPLGMITGSSKKAGFNDGDVFAQLHFDPDFDSAEKQRLMIDVLDSDNKKYLTSIGETSIASAATRKHNITLRDLESYLQKASPNADTSAGYRDFAGSYFGHDGGYDIRANRVYYSNLAQIEAILNLAQVQGITIDENTQVSDFLTMTDLAGKTYAEILREQVQAYTAYTAERQYEDIAPVRYGYGSPEGLAAEVTTVDIKKAAKPKKAKVTIAGEKTEKPTFYSSQYKLPAAGAKARLISLPHASSLPELRISDKKGTLSEDFSLSMEAILNKSPEYSNLILRSEAIVLGNSYTEAIKSINSSKEAAGLQQAIKAQESVYDKFFSGRDNNAKLNAASQLYVLNDHINRIQGSGLDEEEKSAINATLAFIAKAVLTRKKFLEYEDNDFRDLFDQVSQIPKDQRNAVLNAVAIGGDLSLTVLTGEVVKKSQSLLAVRQVEVFYPEERASSDQGRDTTTTTEELDSLGQGLSPTTADLYSSGQGPTTATELGSSGWRPTTASRNLSDRPTTTKPLVPTTDERDLSDRGDTTAAVERASSGQGPTTVRRGSSDQPTTTKPLDPTTDERGLSGLRGDGAVEQGSSVRRTSTADERGLLGRGDTTAAVERASSGRRTPTADLYSSGQGPTTVRRGSSDQPTTTKPLDPTTDELGSSSLRRDTTTTTVERASSSLRTPTVERASSSLRTPTAKRSSSSQHEASAANLERQPLAKLPSADQNSGPPSSTAESPRTTTLSIFASVHL